MVFQVVEVDGCRVPEWAQIGDEDWVPAFTAAMEGQRRALERVAVSRPATIELIREWERSGVELSAVCAAFGTAREADTNERRDEIEALIAPQLARHADAIVLDRRLYDRLAELQARVDAGEVAADEQDAWWLSEKLREFRRGGVTLGPSDQARLKALNEQLAACQSEFAAALVKARAAAGVHMTDAAQLAGLDEAQMAAARGAAQARGLDGWVIELVNTTRQPILADLDDRDTRRRVFEASVKRGQSGPSDVRETILAIARLRDEKARLLGFAHYAAYVADDGCAKTTDAVMALLEKAAAAAVANARAEAARLQDHLNRLIPGATLEAWDWAWVAEKVRKADYDVAEKALAPYLRFETVLEQGVFEAANRLYGLTFTRRDDIAGYTHECRTYAVHEADGALLGLVQVDPYARPSKQGGAWMTPLTQQSTLTGDRPVVTNNCNLTRPAPGEPSVTTWDQVTTLFHEFGHDLHGLLADVRYPSVSGTRVPPDFVEFPSQVNEMWAWEPSVIASFARHRDTGEPMPDALVGKLLASRHFGEGFDSLELFAAMLLDQAWHQASADELPDSADGIDAFEQAALARFGVDFPLVPPRYRSCYFSHIWGGGHYAAGYYDYLWAEVLDADTVAWFAENGGLTRANGDTFRRDVLSVGGSRDVMAAYRRFRGADPDPVHVFARRGLIPAA